MKIELHAHRDFVIHGNLNVGSSEASGSSLPGSPTKQLHKLGEALYRGRGGETLRGVSPVRVLDEVTGMPISGVPIRYQVLQGLATFGDGRDTAIVKTDESGHAPVDVFLTKKGVTVFGAEFAKAPVELVPFATRTEGVCDAIFLQSSSCVAYDAGPLTVEIRAIDHEGRPVTGADLLLSTAIGGTYRDQGEIAEIGEGRYRGTVTLRAAGEWTLEVSDREGGQVGRQCVRVLPGLAKTIRILRQENARDHVPRNAATLIVDLVDEIGNSLDPTRIEASADGAEVEIAALEHVARVRVHRNPPGTVVLRLFDRQTGIATEVNIEYGAGCLGDPGLILTGDSFSTPLFLFPREPDGGDDPVLKAEMRIAFNPDMVTCGGFTPAISDFRVTGETGDRELLVHVASEVPLRLAPGQETTGIYIGAIQWQCLLPGETCFEVKVAMSPDQTPWRWCPKQKADNPQCICMEVLYPPGYRSGPGQAAQCRQNVLDVLSSEDNVSRCCPILDVQLHHRALNRAELRAVVAAIGRDGKNEINSEAEFFNLVDQRLGDHPECIQIFLLVIDAPDFSGGHERGKISIDPVAFGNRNNVPAHEVAHALGLPDRYKLENGEVKNSDPNDLMGLGPPPRHDHGSNLSAGDCQIIFQNLKKYKCP